MTKVRRGWWATEDGRLAAIQDGAMRRRTAEADDPEGWGWGGEWAAVKDDAGRLRTDVNAGDTLDWFDTKAAALDALARHA